MIPFLPTMNLQRDSWHITLDFGYHHHSQKLIYELLGPCTDGKAVG